MFDNKVMRRGLRSEIDEMRGRRKLHEEELHKLYSSPNVISHKIKKDQLSGICRTYGGDEKCVQNFGRNT